MIKLIASLDASDLNRRRENIQTKNTYTFIFSINISTLYSIHSIVFYKKYSEIPERNNKRKFHEGNINLVQRSTVL